MDNELIRIASENDLPALITLYSELNPSDDLSDSGKIESTLRIILNSSFFNLFVLEANGKLVSSCYLNIIPNLSRDCRPYAVIENVITLIEYRKHGFGKKVMQHAIDYAKAQGCYKVMLLTGRKDPSVHSFYQSLGFDGSSKTGYQIRF
ncbi:MAG: GNAT family N-acetyltransferase [Fibrobacteres bacterium]|nr:GNAT family N-acetyltransferase [Fibrobacterota bacterium]